MHDFVVIYFGNTTSDDYKRIYEIIAKRHNKAFFLRAS